MTDNRHSRLHGQPCAVVGGAGFVGSYVVEAALSAGASRVVVYDNFSRGTMENLSKAQTMGHLEVTDGDIRDVDQLCTALNGCSFVFHQAAVHLRRCENNPREALEINEVGAFNVAEACVRTGVEKLVAASSSSVYGEGVYFPTDEEHPLLTTLFYGAAKVGAERYYAAFSQKYGLKYVGLRYLNVYGPRQDSFGAYTEVIPSFLNCIAAQERPVIHGNGGQTLDLVFVQDVAKANLAALDSDVNAGFFNISSGVETTVLDLFRLLCHLCGVSVEPLFLRDNLKLSSRRYGTTQLASQMLGFVIETPLAAGLQEVIDWHSKRR